MSCKPLWMQMVSAIQHSALFNSFLRQEFSANKTTVITELRQNGDAIRRRSALKKVDRELSRGDFKSALSLVKQLKGKPGGLRGFGAAEQVPRRLSSLDELNINGVDTLSLQSLVDSILNLIEQCIEFASPEEASYIGQVGINDGGNESLSKENHRMCIQHEAGHFLVAYLLGVLPKGYLVPSIEDMRQDPFAGGRVEFVGFDFLKEVTAVMPKKLSKNAKPLNKANKGVISSKHMDGRDHSSTIQSIERNRTLQIFALVMDRLKFSCIILAGLVVEFLLVGYSEGLHSDVEKLDRVLKWLGLTESEADSHVKWAVTNTVLMLIQHREARSRLAEAMSLGRSVGCCIDSIETALNGNEI